MYAKGEGTTKNLQKAFKYFTKSAKQGNSNAQDQINHKLYHEESQKKV